MVDLFKALSDGTRLRMLSLVMEREMCVCEIEACLEISQTNASRHLMLLRKCGILEYRKKAQWAYYSISQRFVIENKELYVYLQRKLRELPTYVKDCEKIANCCNNELCLQPRRPKRR